MSVWTSRPRLAKALRPGTHPITRHPCPCRAHLRHRPGPLIVLESSEEYTTNGRPCRNLPVNDHRVHPISSQPPSAGPGPVPLPTPERVVCVSAAVTQTSVIFTAQVNLQPIMAMATDYHMAEMQTELPCVEADA